MRITFLLFVLFQLTVSNAQGPGGRGQRGGAQQRAKIKTPKFEAVKVAGIFEYDSKKVLKKVKIKKKDSIAVEVKNYLAAYNSEINIIKLFNKDLFEGLDIVVNQNIKSAIQNRDREAMMSTRRMIAEKLEPVTTKVILQEEQLNTALKLILSEEQNKKWLNYQKTQKEKLKPQVNTNRDRPNKSGGSRKPAGRRGGF